MRRAPAAPRRPGDHISGPAVSDSRSSTGRRCRHVTMRCPVDAKRRPTSPVLMSGSGRSCSRFSSGFQLVTTERYVPFSDGAVHARHTWLRAARLHACAGYRAVNLAVHEVALIGQIVPRVLEAGDAEGPTAASALMIRALLRTSTPGHPMYGPTRSLDGHSPGHTRRIPCRRRRRGSRSRYDRARPWSY